MIRRYIKFTELFIGFAFGILLNNFFEEKFPNEFKTFNCGFGLDTNFYLY